MRAPYRPAPYRYVGSKDLLELAGVGSARWQVTAPSAVVDFVASAPGGWAPEGIVATFVVDEEGRLWIASRHSEHVACARGGPVRSAGELTFEVTGGQVRLTGASNQSSGYCPEPKSWPAVEVALRAAGIAHPGAFTVPIAFRRCAECGQRNIVKEEWFFCGACDAPLPRTYNCQGEAESR